MTAPSYARAAAEFLARTTAPLPVSESSRAEAILRVEAALDARRRRAARTRALGWVGGCLGAAAACVLIWGAERQWHKDGAQPARQTVTMIAHPVGHAVRYLADGSDRPLEDGVPLEAETRVLSGSDGTLALTVSTGTLLSLDRASELALQSLGAEERFELLSGGVRADVAKLHAGERFVMNAGDVEVEVHGTSFRVMVLPEAQACPDGSRTSVVVYEGVVTVRRHGAYSKLSAGEELRPTCTEPPPAGLAAVVTSRPSAATRSASAANPSPRSDPRTDRSSDANAVRSAPEPYAPKPAGGQLANDNNLFEQGVSARHRGDVAGAVDAFDRLLARSPRGPLAEGAAAERLRLLRTSDRARAATAARKYLDQFPAGFARAEAASILADAP